MNIKGFVRSLPVIGPLSYKVMPSRGTHEQPFDGSREYWERRYATGGNSGAGSYNRLAEFKAEVIGDIMRRHSLASVIEFGCGDGAQLALADYPDYIGIDVSPTILEQIRERFADRPEYRFILSEDLPPDAQADVALSLDVIYHLVEDEAFAAYMRALFDSARKMVVVYASNHDAPGDAPHVRHRAFGRWVETHRPGFRLIETIPNRYPFDPAQPHDTSFANFYVYAREG